MQVAPPHMLPMVCGARQQRFSRAVPEVSTEIHMPSLQPDPPGVHDPPTGRRQHSVCPLVAVPMKHVRPAAQLVIAPVPQVRLSVVESVEALDTVFCLDGLEAGLV